ncbi:Importin-7 [Portunus trituberculatus]|uniref:Importin-7 n=1 Tax=Portunus trituberculatus TaxID=210409 RepID=A0A5B7FL71_PORTR|nr:Importin-7 [Portunus trituberculatus]
MLSVVQDVLFPLMCYSDADQELWNSDPYEYVRVKFDIYEDLVSPVTAAQGLLLSTVRKRKEMLEKTMVFLMQVLTTPNVDPRHKDGVMHMIGTLGGVLLKKKIYKDQMETMIAQYVFPEFQSPFGFMRARVIKETENDDLTNVMCKIVTTYTDQLTPIAVEMCTQLAATFQQAITAMGLLSTIETLINCMEENPKIMEQIEPITLQVVGLILTKNVMEFYEEALALVYSLTSTRISPDLWKCFEMMFQMFKSDGFDYFTEMMPALHNYITVDTEGFISSEARIAAVFEMCKTVLTQVRCIAKASEENSDDEDDGEEDEDIEHEVLESDEDELDDNGDEYLEKLGEKVKKASAASPFAITATVEQDEEDDDDSDDEMDETALESFTTPLDREECEVDEYCVFKDVMQSKWVGLGWVRLD